MNVENWSDDGFRTVRGPGEWENEEIGPSRAEARAAEIGDSHGRLTEYDETVYADSHLSIPGFGEGAPDCGEFRPTAVCETCGEIEFGPHRCGRRTCPDCWGSWAREQSISATVRLQSFRESQPNNWKRQMGHAVWSPDDPPKTLNEVQNFRSRAYEVAKEKGMRGGTAIVHPWRLDEETMARYEKVDPDMGRWVWLRNVYEESWRDRVVWEPHVHIIGAMTKDMKPGTESEPFVWKLIRTFDRYNGSNDRNSHEEVYSTVRYLLSHAAVPTEACTESMRSRTWFGELHGSLFQPEEEIAESTYRRLKRVVEEVADGLTTDEEAEKAREESDDMESGDCPCEGCDGVLIEVLEVKRYLGRVAPPPDVEKRMQVCYEYRMGDVAVSAEPESEEAARELIERLV